MFFLGAVMSGIQYMGGIWHFSTTFKLLKKQVINRDISNNF